MARRPKPPQSGAKRAQRPGKRKIGGNLQGEPIFRLPGPAADLACPSKGRWVDGSKRGIALAWREDCNRHHGGHCPTARAVERGRKNCGCRRQVMGGRWGRMGPGGGPLLGGGWCHRRKGKSVGLAEETLMERMAARGAALTCRLHCPLIRLRRQVRRFEQTGLRWPWEGSEAWGNGLERGKGRVFATQNWLRGRKHFVSRVASLAITVLMMGGRQIMGKPTLFN